MKIENYNRAGILIEKLNKYKIKLNEIEKIDEETRIIKFEHIAAGDTFNVFTTDLNSTDHDVLVDKIVKQIKDFLNDQITEIKVEIENL